MAGIQLVFEIPCYISYPYNNILIAYSAKVDKRVVFTRLLFRGRYLNLENIPLCHNN